VRTRRASVSAEVKNLKSASVSRAAAAQAAGQKRCWTGGPAPRRKSRTPRYKHAQLPGPCACPPPSLTQGAGALLRPPHKRARAVILHPNLPRQAAAAADRGSLVASHTMSSSPELQGGIAQGIPVGPAPTGPAQVSSESLPLCRCSWRSLHLADSTAAQHVCNS